MSSIYLERPMLIDDALSRNNFSYFLQLDLTFKKDVPVDSSVNKKYADKKYAGLISFIVLPFNHSVSSDPNPQILVPQSELRRPALIIGFRSLGRPYGSRFERFEHEEIHPVRAFTDREILESTVAGVFTSGKILFGDVTPNSGSGSTIGPNLGGSDSYGN
jgi:hypothetical protein